MKLLSEFAARWRKELDPETVKQGRKNRKNTALTEPSQRKYLIQPIEQDNAREARTKLENYRDYKRRNNPGFNGKVLSPEELVERGERQYRLKKAVIRNSLKTNPTRLIPYPSSSKVIDAKSVNSKNLIKNIITNTNNREVYKEFYTNNPRVKPGTIIGSTKSRKAFNQRLQSVGKSAMKKQLLAATAISGVIGGIALARKVRSDKNKKRGKYRRF